MGARTASWSQMIQSRKEPSMTNPTWRRKRTAVLQPGLVLGGLLLVGCDSRSGSVATTTVDSAGITIVQSAAPGWTRDSGRTVAQAPIVDIDADRIDGAFALGAVGFVTNLSDGSIVIQDNGASRLAVFDAMGRPVRTIGRAGQGPGEFEWMGGTYRCAADTLIVDQGSWISVFAPDGRFVGQELIKRSAGTVQSGIEGVSDNCSSLLLAEYSWVEPQPERFSRPSALYWWTRGTARWDTVITFPGPDLVRLQVGGREVGASVPFGRNPVWATRHDLVYYGSSDHAELKIIERTGRVQRVIRWAAPAASVDADDRALYARRRERYLKQNPEEAVVYRPLEDYPVPSRKPFLAGIVVDDADHIWVRQYPRAAGGLPQILEPAAEDPAEMWWVFAPDGRWLGGVTMPSGVKVFRIGADRLLGLYVDTTSVEHVRAYLISP